MPTDGGTLPRQARRRVLALLCAGARCAFPGCGKKGPPLATLRLVPAAPDGLAARRQNDRVYLTFTLPVKNAGEPGAVSLGRVEIYAVTIAPGAPIPPAAELVDRSHAIGQIEVKPPLDEDASEADRQTYEKDARPAPGDVVTFDETLGAPQFVPVTVKTPARAAQPATPPAQPDVEEEEPPAAAAQPAASAPPHPLERLYVVRGISRRGRPGAATAPAAVPMGPPPLPPANVTASFTATSIVLKWDANPAAGSTPATYNVYAASTKTKTGAPTPLNAKPLTTTTFEQEGAKPGVEVCFVVHAVETIGTVPVESGASAPACVTPRDIFPPAPPARLAAVAGPGAINLIWDPNREPDLAGYVVLRGEAGSDTLQPLTPEPIRDTTYRDANVTPGVRYVYAVVAVDRATPPNRSAPSARVEETAR
jgi:hypothetical protein